MIYDPEYVSEKIIKEIVDIINTSFSGEKERPTITTKDKGRFGVMYNHFEIYFWLSSEQISPIMNRLVKNIAGYVTLYAISFNPPRDLKYTTNFIQVIKIS